MLKKMGLLLFSCIIVYSLPINAGKNNTELNEKEKSTTEEKSVRYSLDHILEQRKSNEIKLKDQFLKNIEALPDYVKQFYFLELKKAYKKVKSSLIMSTLAYLGPTISASILYIIRECDNELCITNPGYSIGGGIILATITGLWFYGAKEQIVNLNIIKKIMRDFERKEPKKSSEGFVPRNSEDLENPRKSEDLEEITL